MNMEVAVIVAGIVGLLTGFCLGGTSKMDRPTCKFWIKQQIDGRCVELGAETYDELMKIRDQEMDCS